MATKKWRCTVCGYIHVGETPPDVCPECGVGPEFFESVEEVEAPAAGGGPKERKTFGPLTAEDRPQVEPALFKISYGLFVVGSIKDDKVNAQTCNTVFQITSDPITVAVGINKRNLTWEYIEASGVLSVNILGQDGHDLVKHFGFQSGHKVDKFKDFEFTRGLTGSPLISNSAAQFEVQVLFDKSVDMGTHTLYVGEVVAGKALADREPMTYAYYRQTK